MCGNVNLLPHTSHDVLLNIRHTFKFTDGLTESGSKAYRTLRHKTGKYWEDGRNSTTRSAVIYLQNTPVS